MSAVLFLTIPFSSRIFPRDNKDSAFSQFNIRQEENQATAGGLRRLMDVYGIAYGAHAEI